MAPGWLTVIAWLYLSALLLRRGHHRLRHRRQSPASADGRDERRLPDHRAVLRPARPRAVLAVRAGHPRDGDDRTL